MHKKSIETCEHDASLADLLAGDVAALLAGALARQSALHLPINIMLHNDFKEALLSLVLFKGIVSRD
jgi:hypothetical protein